MSEGRFVLTCGMTTACPDQIQENLAPVNGAPRTVSPAGTCMASFPWSACSSGVTMRLLKVSSGTGRTSVGDVVEAENAHD